MGDQASDQMGRSLCLRPGQAGLHRACRGVWPPMGRPHPLHTPPLLIDEHRRVRAADTLAKRTGQLAELFTLADVPLEEDEPPRCAFPQEGSLLRLEREALTAADERL